MSTNTAPIKYAQRKNSLYLTIALPDVKDEKIVLTDTELKFSGMSEGKSYEVSIEFLKAVDADGSTYKVLPRSVQMHILKKDKEEDEFWPRLLKDKALEKNQVKIDWDRYVDEDEEEEGFDMSNLEGGMGMGGGMPGMGGMGGMPGGMDMEALMKQMGSMGGGAGGMGDLGGMGDMGDFDGGDDDDDDGDDDDLDDLPDLEEAN
jgi:cytosolic prostaglandin-E synthase